MGETNVQPREIPRSGSKAKDGKERKKRERKKRPKVGNNNGQLRIAKPPKVAHTKPPGPIETAGLSGFWTVYYCIKKGLCCDT